MRRWILAVFTLVLVSGLASADGGVISNVTKLIYEPSQKAAIFWEDGNETLILATKIQADNVTNMAWIVPVPSKTEPKVGAGDIATFWNLASVFSVYERIGGGGDYYTAVLLALGIGFFIGVLLLVIAFVARRRRILFVIILFAALCFILTSGLLLLLMLGAGSLGAGAGVNVVDIKKVDIYDVVVLKATNASEMVQWLNENGYAVPENAIPAIQWYCDKGNFYFVVNKIDLANRYNTSGDMEFAMEQLWSGVATPLNITFQPEKPFYPLKISSINEGNSSIDVYVISKTGVVDSSGILQVSGMKPVGTALSGEYSDYYVTLLSYTGDLKSLSNDSTFIER